MDAPVSCDDAVVSARVAMLWYAVDWSFNDRLMVYDDLDVWGIVERRDCVRLSARRLEFGYEIKVVDRHEHRVVDRETGIVLITGRKFRIFPATKIGWPTNPRRRRGSAESPGPGSAGRTAD